MLALARPVDGAQQDLTSDPEPHSVHDGVPAINNSAPAPAEATSIQPAPAGALSASAAEPAEGSIARACASKVAASALLFADAAAMPAAAQGVQQDCSSQAAPAPAELLTPAPMVTDGRGRTGH